MLISLNQFKIFCRPLGVAVGGAVARGVAAAAATQLVPTGVSGTKKPPPR